MPEIKLNYAEVTALAKNMKTNAESFGENQKRLDSYVKSLKASWSGSASDVMQKELQDMGKYSVELQKSLQGMAAFVEKAAQALKETDEANKTDGPSSTGSPMPNNPNAQKEVNARYPLNYGSWPSGNPFRKMNGSNVNCTWYTHQRLVNTLGKDTGVARGNGNNWVSWDANGNYNGTVPQTDTQIPFKGDSALRDILAKYGSPAENIIVSCPAGPVLDNNGKLAGLNYTYGHVMLIDAIVPNGSGGYNVCYSDTNNPGKLVTQSLEAFENQYTKWNGGIQGAMIVQ